MMLAGAKVTRFALPYRRPLTLASGLAHEHRGLLITVADNAGCPGYGEVTAGPSVTDEVLEALESTAGEFARALTGREIDENAEAPLGDHELSGPLAFGFETAALDLIGSQRGRPLAKLLGDGDGPPTSIEVNAMLDRQDFERSLETARDAVARDYRTLKLKFDPGELQKTLELLSELRREHGDRIQLRLDGNGQWSIDEAREGLRRLAAFDLEYIEQPVDSLEAMAALRRDSAIPIAADEAIIDAASATRAIAIGAADVLVLKPAKLGLLAAAACARQAVAAETDLTITSSLESSIGVGAAAHLAAFVDGATQVRRAHGLATAELLGSDATETPLLPSGGRLAVPQSGGLGIAANRSLLAPASSTAR